MHRKHRSTVIAAKLLILSGVAAIDGATNQAGGDTMLKTAKGAFDVKVAPIATTEHPGGTTLGRFSLDKTFHGDLEATGSGEMLTAGTAVPGSAGYVAIGLDPFDAFYQTAISVTTVGYGEIGVDEVDRRAYRVWTLAVVLFGAGTLTIEIEGKAHFYRMEYTLP